MGMAGNVYVHVQFELEILDWFLGGKKIIQDFVTPLSAGNLPLSQHYDPISQYQQNLAEGYLVPTN